MAYDVGPVGLTVPQPQEAPLPEPAAAPAEQAPLPADQAPLPSYEGTVVDETA
jgi:hypothetical protein